MNISVKCSSCGEEAILQLTENDKFLGDHDFICIKCGQVTNYPIKIEDAIEYLFQSFSMMDKTASELFRRLLSNDTGESMNDSLAVESTSEVTEETTEVAEETTEEVSDATPVRGRRRRRK